MNHFFTPIKSGFNSCRRRLNLWVVAIILVIIGFIIFVPIIGLTTLIVALPLLGCAVMCGAMAFMMGKGSKKK